jgi:hypothetical protein
MSNLDKIVKINIAVNTPAVSASSFEHILLVGEPPASPKKTIPDVGIYYQLKELEDLGYITTGENADPVGEAARIAFSQIPAAMPVYVSSLALLPDSTTEYEKAVSALSRALKTDGWYCVCAAGIPESQLEEIAKWTEAQRKIFGYTYIGENDPVTTIYYRSLGFCGRIEDWDEDKTDEENLKNIPSHNKYIHVAAAAKTLTYEPGSETWHLKQLGGVTPSKFSGAFENALKTQNTNYFTTIAGRNVTIDGKVKAGEWIDTIRFRDWLENDMQLRIFNLLQGNSKIPYTDNGIALVQNQMISSLKRGRSMGGIAPDELDEYGNLVPGFTTQVPLAASLTPAERAKRTLSRCFFSARLASAIHAVTVNGALNY